MVINVVMLSDYVVVGSDSGRIVILEYISTKNIFEKVHQETFGKSGCRRIVPGQYLAIDPKGRAVMIGNFNRLEFIIVLCIIMYIVTHWHALAVTSFLTGQQMLPVPKFCYNFEAATLPPPIFKVIKSRQMRWAWHVTWAGMPQNIVLTPVMHYFKVCLIWSAFFSRQQLVHHIVHLSFYISMDKVLKGGVMQFLLNIGPHVTTYPFIVVTLFIWYCSVTELTLKMASLS
jgi:hypothetical protein